MTDAVNLALNFILSLVGLFPNSPFMFLVGLAIVLTIANHIFYWVTPSK